MAEHSFRRLLLIAASLACIASITSAQESAKTNDAEGARAAFQQAVEAMEKKGDQARVMQYLKASFEKGFEHPSQVLHEPTFKPFRDDPTRRAELRKLLSTHARESDIEMVAVDEKGERMLLELEIVDQASGKPLTDTRVYLYHTDAEGDYAPDAESPGGGSENPRLFAFVRTNSKGIATIASILPGSYRGTQSPRHIHLHVDREDSSSYGTGIYFDADAPLDDELREESASGRIAAVKIKADEIPHRAHAKIQVPRG